MPKQDLRITADNRPRSRVHKLNKGDRRWRIRRVTTGEFVTVYAFKDLEAAQEFKSGYEAWKGFKCEVFAVGKESLENELTTKRE